MAAEQERYFRTPEKFEFTYETTPTNFTGAKIYAEALHLGSNPSSAYTQISEIISPYDDLFRSKKINILGRNDGHLRYSFGTAFEFSGEITSNSNAFLTRTGDKNDRKNGFFTIEDAMEIATLLKRQGLDARFDKDRYWQGEDLRNLRRRGQKRDDEDAQIRESIDPNKPPPKKELIVTVRANGFKVEVHLGNENDEVLRVRAIAVNNDRVDPFVKINPRRDYISAPKPDKKSGNVDENGLAQVLAVGEEYLKIVTALTGVLYTVAQNNHGIDGDPDEKKYFVKIPGRGIDETTPPPYDSQLFRDLIMGAAEEERAK